MGEAASPTLLSCSTQIALGVREYAHSVGFHGYMLTSRVAQLWEAVERSNTEGPVAGMSTSVA